MNKKILKHKLNGTIIQGQGKAGAFISVDWVQDQCLKICGFKPFHGTLNVEVEENNLNFLLHTALTKGHKLLPPDGESYCEALLIQTAIGIIPAAIIFPLVNDYPANTIEIIAPCKIKEKLRLDNGDTINFTITD